MTEPRARSRAVAALRPAVALTLRPALAAGLLALLLAGCAGPRGGAGHSGRDGPEANPPGNLTQVPDAVPRIETIRSGGANKPYTVLGRSYTPLRGDAPYDETGLASWYGRKFQGLPTASGERYDMYAMTAAHPTLPIPSYARVRNPANGREVVVRINDRGPFHDGRVIDLSYTAALKLGLLRGVAPVEVHRITNDEIRAGTWQRGGDATLYAGAAVPAPASVAPADAPIRSAAIAPVAYTAAAAPAAVVAASDNPPPAQAAARAPDAPADGGWKVPLTVRGMPAATPGSAASAASPASLPPGRQPADAYPLGGASAASPAPPTAETAQPIPVRPAPLVPAAEPASDAARSAVVATPLPPLQPLEPPQAARAQPAAPGEGGFWLQLGAFGRIEGARQLQRSAAPSAEALAAHVEIFDAGGLHRVQVGPFASRDTASDAAARLRSSNNKLPVAVIVQR